MIVDGKGENRGLIARVGRVNVDIPRSIGYFGGIGLAVAFEVIEWPVGLFIASIPFVKMLNRPKLPEPVRFVEHVLDGMAKPVGGDAEGTIRATSQGSSSESPSTAVSGEARQNGAGRPRRAAASTTSASRRGGRRTARNQAGRRRG